MDGIIMEFKVQALQIKAGRYKVVLNLKMQKKLGIRGGDRIHKRS